MEVVVNRVVAVVVQGVAVAGCKERGVAVQRVAAVRQWRPVIDRLVGALVPQPSINGGSAFGVTTRSIGGSRWRWSGLHVQIHRRRFSFREGEAHSALSSPAFGHGEWRLAKLRAAVLEPEVWVRGPSRMRSRLMMKLSGNGEDVQEEDSTGSRLACLGQSGVKTERRRMTMVSLEAIQSLSSGETRLSMASSGGCAKRFRSSRGG
ncbi:hypothetical protein F2Q68_00015022 [Brassica cretica]|uniref:Uncharacterized protein n=2 Tax=Brassica cretica TaxID=69181 RepID=A0ABQ7F153_BRACR|nr:hypothetical protein F2Q68_00015022 [Brassica cretica]KAF3609502.1 hypothetical protein DY000_02047763 [Brassica cretica]